VSAYLFIGKNYYVDDLRNADCSLIGGQSLTASRKKGQFGTNFVNHYEQTWKLFLKSTAKMASSVATKPNLRHLTCLYEITVFIGLRSTE